MQLLMHLCPRQAGGALEAELKRAKGGAALRALVHEKVAPLLGYSQGHGSMDAQPEPSAQAVETCKAAALIC